MMETIADRKANATLEPPPYRKRSDLIAEEIKRWVVDQEKVPGERLPQEKQLMELFSASKGVVREALKSLEVQGLIQMSTGPGGGATLCEVPSGRALALLANYFYFKPFPAADLYELSKVVEPALAARAVGSLTEEQLAELEETVRTCGQPAENLETIRQQRMAEVRFHEIIAEACPNIFMSFTGKFLNILFYDYISFNKIPEFLPSQEEFRQLNYAAHKKILKGLKDKDQKAVQADMKNHLEELEKFVKELDLSIEKKLLYL